MRSLYFTEKEFLAAWAIAFIAGLPFCAVFSALPIAGILISGMVLCGLVSYGNLLAFGNFKPFTFQDSVSALIKYYGFTLAGAALLSIVYSITAVFIFPSFSFSSLLGLSAFFCFIAWVVNAAVKSYHFLIDWKVSILAPEKRRQNLLRTQLESLRHQLSPHFFFNSLNTLSLVIEEDQDEAVKYVRHIGTLYRYLLHSKENEVVQLASELKFAESYIYLQKMRFGQALDLSVDIREEDKKTLIPPLTLYILLENAIKYNIISKTKPLHIRVFVENGTLQICNNVQMRIHPEEKANVGLENIRSSYSSISIDPMQVKQNNENFIVALPLIKTVAKSA